MLWGATGSQVARWPELERWQASSQSTMPSSPTMRTRYDCMGPRLTTYRWKGKLGTPSYPGTKVQNAIWTNRSVNTGFVSPVFVLLFSWILTASQVEVANWRALILLDTVDALHDPVSRSQGTGNLKHDIQDIKDNKLALWTITPKSYALLDACLPDTLDKVTRRHFTFVVIRWSTVGCSCHFFCVCRLRCAAMCTQPASVWLRFMVAKREDQMAVACNGSSAMTAPWSARPVAPKTETKHLRLHYSRNLALRISWHAQSFEVGGSDDMDIYSVPRSVSNPMIRIENSTMGHFLLKIPWFTNIQNFQGAISLKFNVNITACMSHFMQKEPMAHGSCISWTLQICHKLLDSWHQRAWKA